MRVFLEHGVNVYTPPLSEALAIRMETCEKAVARWVNFLVANPSCATEYRTPANEAIRKALRTHAQALADPALKDYAPEYLRNLRNLVNRLPDIEGFFIHWDMRALVEEGVNLCALKIGEGAQTEFEVNMEIVERYASFIDSNPTKAKRYGRELKHRLTLLRSLSIHGGSVVPFEK